MLRKMQKVQVVHVAGQGLPQPYTDRICSDDHLSNVALIIYLFPFKCAFSH